MQNNDSRGIKGRGTGKQTLSLRVAQSSEGQAETCQLVVACWPTGRWASPLGASRPLHWLCLNKPGRSCTQHSGLPQL